MHVCTVRVDKNCIDNEETKLFKVFYYNSKHIQWTVELSAVMLGLFFITSDCTVKPATVYKHTVFYWFCCGHWIVPASTAKCATVVWCCTI